MRSLLYLLACLLIMASCCPALAQEEPSPADTAADKTEQPAEFTVPEGFTAETAEDPGIFKWKKDGSEIYIISGELFYDSPDALYDTLKKSAKSNPNVASVEDVTIEGGRAFLIKEKPTDEPNRLRMWRLVVITKDKHLHLDMLAPMREFTAIEPAFEAAVASFKLKP